MDDRYRTDAPGLWKGALAGLAGGLAAAWVMTQFQSFTSKLAGSGQNGPEQDEPATERAASAIAESAFERALTEEQKKSSGEAIHYGFGTMNGCLYGMLAEALPASAAAGGALFGAALWLVADESAVPALRLSKPPTAYPISTHVQSLAAHLVYGVTTDAVRRVVREVWRS